MSQLQLKTRILEIESKLDKNGNPYFRLSLPDLSASYFYAFSNSLNQETFKSLTNSPTNFINRQVLITYKELVKPNQGTFYKVKQIELV